MKKIISIPLYPLILMGFLFVLINSCKKSEVTIPSTPTIGLPVLSTTAVTSITLTTATSGGNITSGGGSAVTARGVCWSTSQSFTITNCLNYTTDGADVGSFTSAITGLNPNITYYVRAYAINSTGTGYGNMISFTTSTQLANLTTTAVTSITSTTAVSGGNITDTFGNSVTARGVCYSTTSNPTISNSKTINGTGAGVFTSSITGLTLGNTYYVRAYATNSLGTAYGNEVSFTTVHTIGESYQGGIIAYILQTGDPGYDASVQHGLIAAPSDQSTGIQWYNGSNITTGATGTALGTGLTNTNAIIASQGAGNYAAMLCHNLTLGGYSDWYLPSKDELNKLYSNQATIGGFTNNYYWSSSEFNANFAWFQGFGNGTQGYDYKSYTYYVRAIRAF